MKKQPCAKTVFFCYSDDNMGQDIQFLQTLQLFL